MPNRLPQNLHSTMLLLYLMIGVDNTTIDSIYIPLCFYFIRTIPLHKSRPSHDLHSTMLLLYPRGQLLTETFKREFTFHYASTLSILISPMSKPLHNLHSTMLLLYRLYHSDCIIADFIYIPLCFYFILFGVFHSSPSSMIYIPLCFYFIISSCKLWQNGVYLHSTMLLLYPCYIVSIPRNISIYIPLCFYFIITLITF